MEGVDIRLEGIWKAYGRVQALKDVNIEMSGGCITSILGPSGCGKTTLLKIIAGLIELDKGKVYFNEEDYTYVPPEKRGVGIVFQDLALFPHMDVYDNIAFGLRARRIPETEIKNRVYRVMAMLGLDHQEYMNRRINELSGGQQQRVALARALVLEPKVLLLDEPLAHLDYKVKQKLLMELRGLQRRLGITTVYVTHDQYEAMSLSDYIAILNDGKLIQYGSPRDIYENPENLATAFFFGDANIIDSQAIGLGNNGYLMVRFEDVLINSTQEADIRLEGIIDDIIFQGPLIRVDVRINGNGIVVRALTTRKDQTAKHLQIGDKVAVGWKLSDAKMLRGGD